jgi:hypothetical protein
MAAGEMGKTIASKKVVGKRVAVGRLELDFHFGFGRRLVGGRELMRNARVGRQS